MKFLLSLGIALLTLIDAFGQGTVIFVNRSSLGTSHVYAPGPAWWYPAQVGYGSNDSPTGTTDWTGFTLIGAGGLNGQYGAATTFAQILAANGANQPEQSLTPQGSITTFRTGSGAGFLAQTTATLANIPKDSPVATLEVVAWDNSSGLYSTWALASTAWSFGLIAGGKSGTFNVSNIGGDVNTPPNFIFPSFNLSGIPEPSSIALTSLSVGVALLFRLFRRKGF